MKWLRIALEVIGVSSLLFVAVGTASILHHGTSERIDRAKKKDVLFIPQLGRYYNESGLQNHRKL